MNKTVCIYTLYFDFSEILVGLGEQINSNTETGRARACARVPCNLAVAPVE